MLSSLFLLELLEIIAQQEQRWPFSYVDSTSPDRQGWMVWPAFFAHRHFYRTCVQQHHTSFSKQRSTPCNETQDFVVLSCGQLTPSI